MFRARLLLYTAVACLTVACGPVSDAPIIERYKTATCIPFSLTLKVTPHTREWDTTLTLSNGDKVVVSGAQIPGGRIDVDFLTTARSAVAANSGDYIYPSDVRLNSQDDLLYVKASGAAAGIWHETWLFEYDLRNQRFVEKRQVVDSVLPPECPELPFATRP